MRAPVLLVLLVACGSTATPHATPARGHETAGVRPPAPSATPPAQPSPVPPQPSRPSTELATVDLPELEVDRDVDCAVRVHVALEPLPADITQLAVIVAPHAALASTALEAPCESGRVVRELPRAALEHVRPAAAPGGRAFDLRLAAGDAGPHDDVFVLVCGRDTAGALHRSRQAWGREIGACDPSDEAPMATPSGDVSTYGVERGSVLLARAPTGELITTTVRSARHDRTVKTEVNLRLDDGRTVAAPPALRFAVTGRPAPMAAARLAAGDALVRADGREVHVVATAPGYPSSTDVFDVAWPDTYLWNGLVVGDGRPSPPPATPPATWAAPAETTTLVAAHTSYDCQLTATLTVGALPPDVRSVAFVVAPQATQRGARVPLDCAAGTVVDEVDRATIDALRAAAPVDDEGRVAFRSVLSGGPITCLAPLALLPCARDASGTLVALSPLARFGLAGASCLASGTLIDGPEGQTPIDGLALTGIVHAWDETRRAGTSARVERVVRRPDALVIRLELEGGHALRVTPEHLVYDADAQRFVPASTLRAGGHVSTYGATRPQRITAIDHEPTPVPVFDLHVSPPHTYFANGVLVHNY